MKTQTKLAISSIALVASAQAFALVRPMPESNKACIAIHDGGNDAQYAGNCDETRNNRNAHKEILENGCARGQALLTTYEVKLPSCRDPHIVQL